MPEAEIVEFHEDLECLTLEQLEYLGEWITERIRWAEEQGNETQVNILLGEKDRVNKLKGKTAA